MMEVSRLRIEMKLSRSFLPPRDVPAQFCGAAPRETVSFDLALTSAYKCVMPCGRSNDHDQSGKA